MGYMGILLRPEAIFYLLKGDYTQRAQGLLRVP